MHERRPLGMHGGGDNDPAGQKWFTRPVGDGEAGVPAEGVVLRGDPGRIGDKLRDSGIGHGLSPSV